MRSGRAFGWEKVLEKQKAPVIGWINGAFVLIPGDDLVSHAVARAVPSAQGGLTSVFGMGTGVTLPVRPPRNSKNRN